MVCVSHLTSGEDLIPAETMMGGGQGGGVAVGGAGKFGKAAAAGAAAKGAGLAAFGAKGFGAKGIFVSCPKCRIVFTKSFFF